jgi:catechol-2,3-dioxygenase
MSLNRPPHAGMRHVALNVLDLGLVESFYVNLLGFEVEWRPDDDNVYLCSGVDNLALHVVDDTGSKAQTLAHTGIIVDEIDQVDEWYAYLLENDVKMATQAKTHRDGARSFYCYDPEETVVQIIFHPPLSKG